MNVSREYLERCADETGYQTVTLEKIVRLGELASEIGRHRMLGSALALKGGTALNLCVGTGPTRMSVDLDYNYIAHADRETMQKDRPAIETELANLIHRLGFQVQQSADEFAGRKFYARYQSVDGHKERVEVDVNYLWRVPLAEVERREMWLPGELDRPSVRAVSLLELGVGKFLAYLDRTAPRDAWDLIQLPNLLGEVMDSTQFRRTFVAMSAILPHPLSIYTRETASSRLTEAQVQSQLMPMLAIGQSQSLNQLLSESWKVIQKFVNLEDAEHEYIDRIAVGEFRPELLFAENDDQYARIVSHPAIQWKLRNVRQHLAK